MSNFEICVFSEQQNVLASGSSVKTALEDEVRAPLPVKRDTLYGDPSFFRFHSFLCHIHFATILLT